jgi:branched-chain amino acid transport system permease protein
LVALLAVPRLTIRVPVLFDGPLNQAGNLQLLAVGFTFGVAALSYNLLFGYTGVLSFGHALFFGAGVYLPAIALRHWEWPVVPALLFGLGGGIVLAVVVGALSLRTHGVYFAMVTLAFAEAGAVIVGKNVGGLTGGEEGLSLRTRGLPSWMVGVVNTDKLYWLALAVLIVVYLLAWRLITSPMGHVWKGIRENERRVEMLGLRPYLFKLLAFVISGAFATAGGMVYLFLASGVGRGVWRGLLWLHRSDLWLGQSDLRVYRGGNWRAGLDQWQCAGGGDHWLSAAVWQLLHLLGG